MLSFKEFKHKISIKLQEKFNLTTAISSSTDTSPLLEISNSKLTNSSIVNNTFDHKIGRSVTQIFSKYKTSRFLNASNSDCLLVDNNKNFVVSNEEISSYFYANLNESATSSNLIDTELCLQCPVSLHTKLCMNKLEPLCKCKKTCVPVLKDLELDFFLDFLPTDQLLVLAIIDSSASATAFSTSSTLEPIKTTIQAIIEEIYTEANRTRMQPCKESINDKFRYMFYDVNRAVEDSNHEHPLLYIRHNVIPGMVLVRKYFDLA